MHIYDVVILRINHWSRKSSTQLSDGVLVLETTGGKAVFQGAPRHLVTRTPRRPLGTLWTSLLEVVRTLAGLAPVN
jgi:hypothetical protein